MGEDLITSVPLPETNFRPVVAVTRAASLLHAFQFEGEMLRLRDLSLRTGLSKATAFRLIGTLVSAGLVDRVGSAQYRSAVKVVRRRKYRLGYAGQSVEFAFSRDVTDSIVRAAAQADVELIVTDNRYNSKIALRNAEMLIREGVNLIIEFQTDEHIAPQLSARYLQAAIPVIAVEIPHPGATYYGANNYAAGLLGGRHLGKWAKQQWQGDVEEVLLLELARAGPLPRSRLTGTQAGIKEVLPALSENKFNYLDGNGQFGVSLEAVRKYLRTSRAQRVLIAAVNDPSALGGLRAFEECGRLMNCAVMGQNASLEARTELRRRETRLIGSVGYFPEQYGDRVIALALDIVQKKPVAPAVFVKHQLVTAQNVDHFYPNDSLL